jgi:hypothetical protein
MSNELREISRNVELLEMDIAGIKKSLAKMRFVALDQEVLLEQRENALLLDVVFNVDLKNEGQRKATLEKLKGEDTVYLSITGNLRDTKTKISDWEIEIKFLQIQVDAKKRLFDILMQG